MAASRTVPSAAVEPGFPQAADEALHAVATGKHDPVEAVGAADGVIERLPRRGWPDADRGHAKAAAAGRPDQGIEVIPLPGRPRIEHSTATERPAACG